MKHIWNSIITSCDCGALYRIVADPQKIAAKIDTQHPCPHRCGENARVLPLDELDAVDDDPSLDVPCVSLKEYVDMQNGKDRPAEISPDLAVGRLVRDGVALAKVIGSKREDGTLRVSALKMADGTLLHLAAGPQGVVLYKVTEETNNGGR